MKALKTNQNYGCHGIGGYTGYPCDLLASRRKDFDDDSALLDFAALSVLGSGYETSEPEMSMFRYVSPLLSLIISILLFFLFFLPLFA